MSVTVFGIRHHGPGSARSLLLALRESKPDAVLVEGPPDADGLLALADGSQSVAVNSSSRNTVRVYCLWLRGILPLCQR